MRGAMGPASIIIGILGGSVTGLVLIKASGTVMPPVVVWPAAILSVLVLPVPLTYLVRAWADGKVQEVVHGEDFPYPETLTRMMNPFGVAIVITTAGTSIIGLHAIFDHDLYLVNIVMLFVLPFPVMRLVHLWSEG